MFKFFLPSMLPGSQALEWGPPSASASAILAAAASRRRSTGATQPPVAAAPPAAVAGPAATEAETEVFVCGFTGRRFKSRGAWENYTNSKKYRALSAVRHAQSRGAKPQPAGECDGPAPESASAMVPTTPAPAPPPVAAAAAPVAAPAAAQAGRSAAAVKEGASSSREGGESGDESGWEEVEEAWVPRWRESLFDGRESASFEANVRRMGRRYGFHVPEPDCLLDPRGLFSHLQRKLCERHACVLCDRTFRSLEAVRRHMLDKRHCRLCLEREATLREVAPFYDVPSLWLVRRHGVGHVDELGELVLPRGARLGTRSLRRIYRQSYAAEDARPSVLQARLEGRAGAQQAAAEEGRGAVWVGRAGQGGVLGRQGRLAAKVAARAEAKARHRLLLRSAAVANGTSKALASGYVHKADFADNKHARALQHHGYGGFGGGAHFTMGHSKQFQKGVRVKGVVLRKAGGGTKQRAQAARARAQAERGQAGGRKGNN